jgi:predicted dehydrogenase/threonine dehydrogenase-like Zn-dependent dehydrogenase
VNNDDSARIATSIVKQVAQRSRDGRISVVDAPVPSLLPGWLLVANHASLISAGTERAKLELGARNLAQKARARPDLLRKVVDRARAEGIGAALAAAKDRLDALTPLGYSSAGIVMRLGVGVEGITTGDRVACGGGDFATHAEVIAVPRNLVAAVPEGVPLESAAYATVGAIALHGVRRAEAQLGERVGVIGLGLVGQLAVRILVAAGCNVVGVDLDPKAVTLAAAGGARAFERERDGLENAVLDATDGLGLDSVLVCAASTSPDPVRLASELARERGRVVIVGDVPIEADRALFYEKELELRLSRSYGPGRYDRDYEERGRDLPPAYVRWTEQRNMQAFLELVASGAVDPSPLTTHRFRIEEAERAYALLTEGEQRPFGILLEYAYEERPAPPSPHGVRAGGAGTVRIGLVGAGSFARATLLPALRDAGAELAAVASASGLSATDVAARFGFERAAGSADEIFADNSIDAVVIATRHASHASLTASALRADKAVLVEKPLAVDRKGLAEVEDALIPDSLLMVGFNRRFAPLAVRLRLELEGVASPTLLARVNAGPLPADHWAHDPEEGGGRLIGEGCHFVDLLSYLAGARAVTVHALAVPHPQRPLECSDEVVATLRFANGAVGTLVYSGGGDQRLPKERIEAFGGGLAAVLDDFRRLELYRRGKRHVTKLRYDKGHKHEVARFLQAVRGEADAPAVGIYLESTRATLALAESLRDGSTVEVR